ncbi:MAG: BON domain-containing protein [Prochloraceae cyanobacterium]
MKYKMTNKILFFSLATVLLSLTNACDLARTSQDAPGSLDDRTTDPAEVEATKKDATSDIRQDQLSSDIRAREQRNDIIGDQQKRFDSDLESEVRAKLEANIPRAKLAVDAEDGMVKIVGTVPSHKEYSTIEPLAKEIVGVDNVELDVKVVDPSRL